MSILNEIIANKRLEIEQLQTSNFKFTPPSRKSNQLIKSTKPQFIAEIKPKSPSSGIIRSHFDPENLVLEFEQSGASGISVLTDAKYFGGSIELFKKIRKATKLPLLRKDFILDEIQIYETAQIQADLILFIVKILTEIQLENFLALALELNLQPLIEVNTANELDLALKILGTSQTQEMIQKSKIMPIIGVNNRNLETFEIDLNNSLELKYAISDQYLSFSLSGIKNTADLDTIFQANFDGVLIGQGLAENPKLSNYF